MEFRLITPLIYWLLILIWAYIFVFYTKKYVKLFNKDHFLKVLIFILAIDAFRTLFESLFFGIWYTSIADLIPRYYYDFMTQPHIVFFPKFFNLIVTLLILYLIIRKWLPREESRQISIDNIISSKTAQLQAEIEYKKENEKKLLNEKRRLEAVIESIPDATVIVNSKREILECNNAFVRIFGYSKEETIGRTTEFFYASKDSFNEKGSERYNEEAEIREDRYINIYKRKNGEIFQAETAGGPYKDEKGELLGYIGIMRDISEEIIQRKEKEKLKEQLFHMQRIESIGRLTGGIAHDFNNMLAGIMGYTELLLSIEDDDYKIERLKKINNISEKAGQLTNQLLAFGRKGKNIIHSVNLNKIIEEVVDLLIVTIDKANEIKFELNLSPDLYTVDADPSQIKQVILNPCINSKEAINKKGKIKIFSENISIKNENNEYQLERGEYIKVIIKDNGPGMDSETIKCAFDPFYTTKTEGEIEGNGLGLSTVYGIVKNHSGNVLIKSESGNGCEVEILLPKGIKVNEDKSNKESKTSNSKGTVLIVDDEKSVRTVLSELIKELGMNSLIAKNGNEAICHYKMYQKEISCVFLDLKMPILDGSETFKKLKEIDQDVKVFIVTGYGDNEEVQELIEAGALDLLTKPFTFNDIIIKLNKYIINN